MRALVIDFFLKEAVDRQLDPNLAEAFVEELAREARREEEG